MDATRDEDTAVLDEEASLFMTNLAPGQIWLRMRRQKALVREIISVEYNIVHSRVLHGPDSAVRTAHRPASINGFIRDSRQIEKQNDYSHLDGVKLCGNCLVLDTQNRPLFRCNSKRAKYYLRKGYVHQVSEGVIKFNNETTEKNLAKLYGDVTVHKYFLEIKNDKCVCCGRANRLTRHHIVPKYYIKNLPPVVRQCLSNVLFICIECHEIYENMPKPRLDSSDPIKYAMGWKDHFVNSMNPKFIPKGWDIVLGFAEDRIERAKLRFAENGNRN